MHITGIIIVVHISIIIITITIIAITISEVGRGLTLRGARAEEELTYPVRSATGSGVAAGALDGGGG
jgi:hypothetical protein